MRASTDPVLYRFRATMILFIAGLIVSGITAFPLLTELRLLTSLLGVGSAQSADGYTGLVGWILKVRWSLEATNANYPWLAYGTDWLAFGHLIIALFFVGALFDPLGSRAIINCGIIACLAVIPLALICGAIRGIPIYWRLIDCSFGVFGLVPLFYCQKCQRELLELRLKKNAQD